MLTAMAEQKMLRYAGKLVALVDSSKVGQRAGMLFARTGQIDILITGQDASAEVVAHLRECGVRVELV